ncbi:MAG TPA: hypothetical protein VEY06_14865 [Flavisolibacter sp.]|nr:hypothetical protein [Flavisolibacter sp.]
MNLPLYLYRGDNEILQKKNLRADLIHDQLETTLLNGGEGHLVFTTPIEHLVALHVQSGWKTSHFLSFSESEQTAYRYALDCNAKDVENLLAYSDMSDPSEKDWDFAVIKLNLSKVDWEKLQPGMYEGFYPTDKILFRHNASMYRVLLLHVLEMQECFASHPNGEQIIANAERDKEWLLLPATPIVLNGKKVEYSGLLDFAYIREEVATYKIARYFWNHFKRRPVAE